MKRCNVFLVIICILLCAATTILAAQIYRMRHTEVAAEETSETEDDNGQIPSLSYLQPEEDRVLTVESTAMAIYPENTMMIREIPEGTMLSVLAEAASSGQKWLLVRIRDFHSPSNIIGWVEKQATTAYDDSLLSRLVSPVLIPAGTTIYSRSNDGGILWDSTEIQEADTYGSVLLREDGWLLLGLTGGQEVWVQEDSVQAGTP